MKGRGTRSAGVGAVRLDDERRGSRNVVEAAKRCTASDEELKGVPAR